jgi:hypothetical protein
MTATTASPERLERLRTELDELGRAMKTLRVQVKHARAEGAVIPPEAGEKIAYLEAEYRKARATLRRWEAASA